MQWVVVMFEPALPGEKLKLSEQVNEVFGPFDEDPEEWTARMKENMPENRTWLIIPLSDPAVVNKLDPLTN